jgi:4-amino-4-deoxy-L-arabinose transferase-like glycosyltransferase
MKVDDMRESVRYQLWIAAAAGVIFFTNLGSTGLWDMDEALYTSCAREMHERGDLVEPRFNDRMFPEKPPLMFWTMIAGFELCGVNEWGARLLSAVFGVATALAAFHIGRILFNARVGLWTGLITASTIIFTISARAATADSGLTLVTTVALLMFVMGRKGPGVRGQGAGASDIHHSSFIIHHSPSNPPKFNLRYAIPMYACIGLAVLAKGPVGMLLPLAAMGLYLLVADGWRNVLRSAWWMRPLTALLVVAAVAVPWYVWVGYRTDGQWLWQFFVEFNLRPFKQPIQGHGDASSLNRVLAIAASFSYYFYQIPAVLVGFFPWSVFLGPTLVDTVQRIRRRDHWRDGCLLAACWFGVWFVFWSICKTKLPHYLLPAYPALALLTACFVDRWQTAGEKGTGPICAQHPEGGHRPKVGHGKLDLSPFLPPCWLRNAWISMILVGVGIMIAIPIVAMICLPGEAWIAVVGVIPLVGGCWCWWKTAHDKHAAALTGFAVTAVVFLTTVFGWAATQVDRHQNAQPMIAAIRADGGDGAPIAVYRFFRFLYSTVYYAGHPVTECDNDEKAGLSARDKLEQFLKQPTPSYVITTSQYEPELQKDFAGQLQILFRQRLFLSANEKEEMVVLRAGPTVGKSSQ